MPATKQIPEINNDNFTLSEFMPNRDGGRRYTKSQPYL
ncbi:hypothetical protein PUND_a2815 [Pseudoalteromonas undina]|nr:hypothetical protein PUND_a2815 [Pseudoalteromonas undina]